MTHGALPLVSLQHTLSLSDCERTGLHSNESSFHGQICPELAVQNQGRSKTSPRPFYRSGGTRSPSLIQSSSTARAGAHRFEGAPRAAPPRPAGLHFPLTPQSPPLGAPKPLPW